MSKEHFGLRLKAHGYGRSSPSDSNDGEDAVAKALAIAASADIGNREKLVYSLKHAINPEEPSVELRPLTKTRRVNLYFDSGHRIPVPSHMRTNENGKFAHQFQWRKTMDNIIVEQQSHIKPIPPKSVAGKGFLKQTESSKRRSRKVSAGKPPPASSRENADTLGPLPPGGLRRPVFDRQLELQPPSPRQQHSRKGSRKRRGSVLSLGITTSDMKESLVLARRRQKEAMRLDASEKRAFEPGSYRTQQHMVSFEEELHSDAARTLKQMRQHAVAVKVKGSGYRPHLLGQNSVATKSAAGLSSTIPSILEMSIPNVAAAFAAATPEDEPPAPTTTTATNAVSSESAAATLGMGEATTFDTSLLQKKGDGLVPLPEFHGTVGLPHLEYGQVGVQPDEDGIFSVVVYKTYDLPIGLPLPPQRQRAQAPKEFMASIDLDPVSIEDSPNIYGSSQRARFRRRRGTMFGDNSYEPV